MRPFVTDIYVHNLWANQRILEFCAPLTSEQLAWEAPGTFGPISRTLLHIVAAEARYAARLAGETPPELGFLADNLDFEVLKEKSRASGEALQRLATTVDPDARFVRQYDDGAFEMTPSVVLVQAINHATEHRSQILTSLTQHGVTPPDLDSWTWAEETGLMKKV